MIEQSKLQLTSKNSDLSNSHPTLPILEIVSLILFGLVPCAFGHAMAPMAMVMVLGFVYGLPLSAVLAWYAVLVGAIGILHQQTGMKYAISVVFCLLLTAAAMMIWLPWAIDSTVNWIGVLQDPWIVGTNLPFAIAVTACVVRSVLQLRARPTSEWQFTMRDGFVFVSATAVFLGVVVTRGIYFG